VIADFNCRLPIIKCGFLIGIWQMEIGNHSPPLFTISVFTYSLVMRNTNRDFSLILAERRVVPSGRLWNPAADVYRCAEGWVVKVDLAGVCSDELEVEIRGSLLSIRGCRRDTHYRDGFVYQQMEITYSRFEKSIQFPTPIEGASIGQDYTDGFLIINVQSEQG
jgi:HSP20 family protein